MIYIIYVLSYKISIFVCMFLSWFTKGPSPVTSYSEDLPEKRLQKMTTQFPRSPSSARVSQAGLFVDVRTETFVENGINYLP